MKATPLAAALFLAVAGPAPGEWLAPRGSQPIETVGPWELRGTGVVFTATDGGLYLLPASAIDWPRTRALNLHPAVRAVGRYVRAHNLEIADPVTLRWVVGGLVAGERARVAALRASPEPVAPRLVLTDADVAHVSRRIALPEEQFPIRWRRSYDGPGEVSIAGTVTNRSERTLTGGQVEIGLLDEAGELRKTQVVALDVARLPPGEKASFEFKPREEFTDLTFQARGRLGSRK